ncbi:pentatricopeptide repeat-containing protein At2g41080-like [Selaginella moellendorffii]|uniref:pentatricopeptide repeat-containing protein At2g41080-like n=1 Tax=Selaginella moellendorffii TaxID=88036 RepID=UPI000D1CA8A7|nr:pentatricopeptide repeat-containing protein At2g41080-like [Selaginella moellendorffii]|eukprot:XP_024532426.1 pentatricopeptide repeat-containing protein At2g41080-like [Selaginella moellendorffii]
MEWKTFFRDPTFWWDNRFKKKNKFFSESYPDFKHVSTGESLWIANRKTPTWVSAKVESLADPAVGKATTARYKSPHTPPVAGDEPVSLGRLIHLVRDSAESRSLSLGKQAHEAVLKSDEHKSNIYLLTGLIDMYCKCGELEEARKIFDSMGTRSLVSYNTIIQGCGSNGQAELALEYYSALRACTTTDACTYTCVLVACGSVMAIKLGREIHQLAKHKGLLKNDPVLGSSLVTFYGKCGDVDSAQEAFDECRARDDTGLWNSLIQAYTLQGRSVEALERFYSMTQEEGCKANDVSFVSVLKACSHGGLVGKGRQLLDEMPKQYGVKPRLEHYVCLIDMLGRANLLDEAVRVLRAMPFEPDAVVWTSLLGACRKWKNYTIGKLAFERLVEMDPKSGTPYALMANIFGNLGMLSERAAVVERMRGEGSFREPGRSWWTDVSSGKVHSFSVRDRSHSQSDEIAAKLKQLLLRMKEEGYASDVINVLKDIPEEEKEDHLCGHSEKLALGCALVNSHQKETIRIVKNLPVCDGCHAATALISKLEKRLIICKDASRVHVFQDGRCSCDNCF